MPPRLSIAALAMLALAAVAFWPGYLSRLATADQYTHAYAALGTCWPLLLVAQPLLINASLRPAHRLLGRIGVLVGVCFAVSGIPTAHRSVARMGVEQFAREGRFVSLPPRSRGRSAFLRFALVVVVVLLGFFAIPHRAPWLALTAWFRALPMT